MRANLSRGESGCNSLRSSFFRSLLEFFSGQSAGGPERGCFFEDSMQVSVVLASAILVAAWRSVEGKTLNKLLSVPVEDRTPNIVCAQGAKSFSGAAPSILRFPIGKPALATGCSHQLTEHKVRHRYPSGRFQLGAFRQRAFLHIPPQSNQQFASQRHNANSSHPAATFGKALAIPAAQLAVGLVA